MAHNRPPQPKPKPKAKAQTDDGNAPLGSPLPPSPTPTPSPGTPPAAEHGVAQAPVTLRVELPGSIVSHGVYQAALSLAEKLVARGHRTLFVGGFVRELAISLFTPGVGAAKALGQSGSTAMDIDIATDADPAEIRAVFRNAHFVGQVFGVSMVDVGPHCFEVATFRSEGKYSDGRRPDAVTKGTLHADAARRDFTVNALYFDPFNQEIIDFFRGVADVRSQVIRTVGSPEQRFWEDRLRIIRMCRFASLLDFEIDDETWKAGLRMAEGTAVLSRERILIEIKKTPPRGVPRFLTLLHLLRLDQLLWGLTFDDVPVWLGRPKMSEDLEVLLAREAHYPVSFVAVAAWKHLMAQPSAARSALVENLRQWPTTVEDRRLVQGLGQLARLFDRAGSVRRAESGPEAPAAGESGLALDLKKTRDQLIWLTALFQVVSRLSPLGPLCLEVLCEAWLDETRAGDWDDQDFAFETTIRSLLATAFGALAVELGRGALTPGWDAVSRQNIVSAVSSAEMDPRWIGVTEAFARLRGSKPGLLSDDLTRLMDDTKDRVFGAGLPDASLLAELRALVEAIR